MRSSSVFFLVLLLSSLVAFFAQLLIDFTTVNIASSSIVLVTSILISAYIVRTDAIQTDPLSTFAIFGFAVTTQIGALLIQSFSWTSLVSDLRQPLETFATLFLYFIVALVAHIMFRQFKNNRGYRPSTISAFLERLELYQAPSTNILWIMGWLGVMSMIFGRGDAVGSKIWDGFKFLAYAPFVIPIHLKIIGEAYCNAKKEYLFLLAWFLLITLFGILIGSRSTILTGIMNVALIYFLALLRNNFIVSIKQISKFILRASLLFVLIIPLVEPITNASIAIQISRFLPGYRLDNFIATYNNTYVIEKYVALASMAKERSAYDETYIKNTLLQRFVETKFHDNALYFASKLSEGNINTLESKTIDLLLGAFPQPILDFCKIDVDKFTLKFSMGDYLAYLSSGIPLGGFRTGSIFAQGQALFGLFFIPMYFGICMVLFNLMSLLTRREKAFILISTPGMLMMWQLFISGITAESLHQTFNFIFRNFFQMLIIYLVIYWICRMFVSRVSIENHDAPIVRI